jgi:hypothetical protein
MKILAIASVITVTLSSVGCSNVVLHRAALNQAATVTDIQYQIVLDNIAMLKSNPGALPWHVKLLSGTVTANNEVASTGTYQVAEAVSATPARTITRIIAATPKAVLQQGWTISPVTDAHELRALRTKYLEIIDQAWVHHGGQPASGAFVGSYKGSKIWVSPADLNKLTEATLLILTAAPVKDLEKAFAPFMIPQPSISSPR